MTAKGLGHQEGEIGFREAQSTSNFDVVIAAVVERGADGVNLSLEPDDGNPAHSDRSVMRARI